MQDEEINQTEPEIQPEAITWESSEYIHHEKDALWFGLFGLGSAAVMLLMYLILDDILSVVVVGLMVVAVIVYANRPPRTLKYSIDDDGLNIGERQYPYDSFKSFSIVQEGAIESIILNPLQRFMPPITVYFPPDNGEQIVEILSHYMPLKEYEPDLIDRFAQRIRF